MSEFCNTKTVRWDLLQTLFEQSPNEGPVLQILECRSQAIGGKGVRHAHRGLDGVEDPKGQGCSGILRDVMPWLDEAFGLHAG